MNVQEDWQRPACASAIGNQVGVEPLIPTVVYLKKKKKSPAGYQIKFCDGKSQTHPRCSQLHSLALKSSFSLRGSAGA